MDNPYLIAAAAVFLFVAQLCLAASILAYEIPGAQTSLANGIKADLPPEVIPVLISYYPQLNALTYESAVEYCKYKTYLAMDLNAEGITSEYVCEIVEGGLVSNTDELRLFLARKVVEGKVDQLLGIYGPQVGQLEGFLAPIVVVGAILAILAFAACFFGSETFPKCAFYYSLFSGVLALGNMLLMGLAFFLSPSIVMGKAGEIAGAGIGKDVLSLMSGDITGAVEGIFVAPILVFGVLSFIFGVAAVLSYMMSIKPEWEREERGKEKRKARNKKASENK